MRRSIFGRELNPPGMQFRTGTLGKALGDIRGDITRSLTGTKQTHQFFTTPVPGDAQADGSPGNPFNLTSAESNGYEGPIGQALAQAVEPTNAYEEMVPLEVVIGPGEYPSETALNFPEFKSITLRCIAPCRVGSYLETPTMNWTPRPFSYYETEEPMLHIIGEPTAAILFFYQLRIGNKNRGNATNVYINGAQIIWGITEHPDGQDGTSYLVVRNSDVATNGIVVPNSTLYVDRVGNTNVTTAKEIEQAMHTRFNGNVTVTAAGSAGAGSLLSGFYNCSFGGSFTGPVDSARFDKFTQDNGPTGFSGGAGAADYLEA